MTGKFEQPKPPQMVNDSRQRFEKELAALVEKFHKGRDENIRPSYSEAQARLDFINPLFEALGWDVKNTAGLSLEKREVKVEQGETTGKPDYNFRVDGRTVFFVEAKAPHVPLESSRVILQAKKYAFNETSQEVMLAAATDFEEFRLYEVRDISYLRRINKGLIFAHRYDEYLTPQALDDLWQLSREQVVAGSLDKLITPEARRARQRIPLDQQFLSDLTAWREKLAKAVFKTQLDLEASDLNSVVQIFLDRLIFIRVAEDRGVLARQVLDIAQSWKQHKSRPITAELLPLFRVINRTMNGEIFKPHRCEEIEWDSALVTEIIEEGLEPYNFAQIGVELLGSIYERYLGKTIRVTETRAMVEDKPEVRKAGGVYYTPKYIVDYIVAQTVGKLIESKTPAQIAKLRILDPACGSGSFLLAAYQTLLDYHTRYYAERANQRSGGGGNGGQILLLHEQKSEYGEFKLSLEQKAQILRNNIFGVDIDPQAVEITMMSLYIKMLEGERGAIVGQGVLPPLKDNIKCGNSLIGYDIGALSEDDKARINPFDWNSKGEGFGEIMAAGGFDAVIGNPPYSAKQSVETKRLTAFLDHVEYKCDPYAFFIEQGLRKIKRGGRLGYIVPVTWMTNFYYQKLRRLFLESQSLRKCVLIDGLVFKGANVDTCLLFLDKEFVTSQKFEWSRATPENLDTATVFRDYKLIQSEERYDISPEANDQWLQMKTKVDSVSKRLDMLGKISLGMKLRSNSEFVSDKRNRDRPDPIYFGNDVSRYGALVPTRFFNQKTAVVVGGTKNPAIQNAKPKIFIQAIRNLSLKRRIVATLDSDGACFVGTLNAFTLQNQKYDIRYILGLLSSTLLNTYFRRRFTTISLTAAFLGVLPIRTINFDDPADKAHHDKMVTLVERMLELHKQKHAAKSDAARERIEREIHVTDEQIDALVYELYGLTKEEIRIVEESAR